MKHLCCSRAILVLLFSSLALFASLKEKSAIVYYGSDISYSMVGIHDYIIVNPVKINTYSHGFDVYEEHIYARVQLESDLNVMKKNVALLVERGFKNFYIECKDENYKNVNFSMQINYLLSFYQNLHFIVNSKFDIGDDIRNSLSAVLVSFDSKLSKKDKMAFQNSAIDIIKLVEVSANDISYSQSLIEKISQSGFIPYISTNALNLYGYSSKHAVKREIFTLIDESKLDRHILPAHQVGAMPLEYLGYIQKLYDVEKGLPDIDLMRHYAGVVIWLNGDYKEPEKLLNWILKLEKIGIKVVFANSFGFSADATLLKALDIDMYDGDYGAENKKNIFYADKMIGFEISPSLGGESIYLHPNNAEELLVYEDSHGDKTTLAAITPWGGYAIAESFMHELGDENAWVINPFEFFAKALRLKKIAVPDTTTQNGNRIFFTHVDGDGMVNAAEFNPKLFSGDVILKDILKVYPLPHSVSIIGAEVAHNGLFPQYSKRTLQIAKDMYALDNVEPATHTFSHPFFWDKVINNHLDAKYRLHPKGYVFSLENEFSETLNAINNDLLAKGKKKRAQTVFWSGDCAPRLNALDYLYKHKILNINGGDTTISNVNPWLTLVAPLGLQRGDYYQIYTGAQNENVFTNDWLGPFWGFKRVVQTFKLTNSPRRLKPIDIYYHLYSGSKTASLNALKYIFNWAQEQEIYPIFTSNYIPKAMDFFTVSIANEGNAWFIAGMKDLKTIRIDKADSNVKYESSPSVYGVRNFKTHSYIALNNHTRHYFELTNGLENQDVNYLIASNARISEYIQGVKRTRYIFDGFIDLKVVFHLKNSCKLFSTQKYEQAVNNKETTLLFPGVNKATIDVICR